jgi:hypothetical protein
MNDQTLQDRANEVEKEGVARYGKESWSAMVGAIGRLGATPHQVAETLKAPDAVDRFARAGREGLLADLTNPDAGISRQAERVYSELRQRERAAHHSTNASAYRTLVPNADRR